MGTFIGKPYTEVIEEEYVIREFSETVNESELIWHRDKANRQITVLHGEGWKLQLDNKQPVELMKGKLYDIPKEEYHRLIKGKDNLIIQIWEEKHD